MYSAMLQFIGEVRPPVPLPAGTTTLGRGEFLSIADKRVSRKQAQLDFDANTGIATLTVLGVNPSHVKRANSETFEKVSKGSPVQLRNEDVIRLISGPPPHHILQICIQEATEFLSPEDVAASAPPTATVPAPDAVPPPSAPASDAPADTAPAVPPADEGGAGAAAVAAAAARHKAKVAAAAAAATPKSNFDKFLENVGDMEASFAVGAAADDDDDGPEPGVDLAFCFDTTGSMYETLEQVRKKLKETITKLFDDIDVRVAIIAFGDYFDAKTQYVIESLDFSRDVDRICKFVNAVTMTDGGDAAECYEYVLRKATQLSWGEGRARGVVLIGDDVPHPPSYTDLHIDWREEATKLTSMGVKIYSVQASDNKKACPFYEELARISEGYLLHLTQMDWMEIMFVALCYRQHSQHKFEQYRQGLIWTKQLTHESPLNTLFLEMATPTIIQKYPSYQGHLKQAWWDPSLDKGRAFYSWNKRTKEWVKVAAPKRKRKAEESSDDGDGDGDGDLTRSGKAAGGGSPKPKKAKKAPAPTVPMVATLEEVDALSKKADIKRQLMAFKKDGHNVTVGGGPNDSASAMKARLRAVLASVIIDKAS